MKQRRGEDSLSESDYSEEELEVLDDEELEEYEEQQSDEEGKEEERETIYNSEVLHDKLEDFGWSEQERWVETLTITSESPTTISNVEDDLERELAFYNQAMSGTKAAIGRFEKEGIAWARPADYMAEMVKSDEHMARIKEQLLHQSKLVQEMEQRRKERESKRFAKQVQAEKRRDREQSKKKAITDISRLRKQRERSGFEGDLDLDAEMESMNRSKPNAVTKNPGDRYQARDQSKKRQRKDAKFGFGGKKRLKKQNDAFSAANVDGYRPSRKGGDGFRAGGGKNKTPNRPGKARRAATRRK